MNGIQKDIKRKDKWSGANLHRQKTYKADLRSQSRSSSDAESSSQNHSIDLAMIVIATYAWIKQLGKLPIFQNWCCLNKVKMLSSCTNECFIYLFTMFNNLMLNL